MTDSPLFSPTTLGAFELRNRIVMAPMTRARAGSERIPNALMAEHYSQRAGAGLIVTEATQISLQGTGSISTPGIHSQKQIDGWRLVTDSVHEAGGAIALQLWHVGRVSHASMQVDGQAPVSASAVHGEVNTFTANGFERTTPPRALERDEISGVVEDFAQGAHNAIAAGFDGVEIHGANGYLIDQFLRDGVNQRTDDYGGSVENRSRLLLEVTDAVIGAVGADRTGVRISPFTVTWDCVESDPAPLFLHATRELDKRGLAFLDVVERMEASIATADRDTDTATEFSPEDLRAVYTGSYIANGGYTQETAEAAVESQHADAVAFARWYISNPDLAERFAADAELNLNINFVGAYGGNEVGYTDYPTMAD
ncbi:MAG: alkene reductase [Myxococcota bacterium]|nr:alkene reductase [Myxococcota bacterium]